MLSKYSLEPIFVSDAAPLNTEQAANSNLLLDRQDTVPDTEPHTAAAPTRPNMVEVCRDLHLRHVRSAENTPSGPWAPPSTQVPSTTLPGISSIQNPGRSKTRERLSLGISVAASRVRERESESEKERSGIFGSAASRYEQHS